MTARKRVSESGTELRYKLMEMAAGLEGVIPLGRGDPDLATPAHIVQAAKDAIRRGAAQEIASRAVKSNKSHRPTRAQYPRGAINSGKVVILLAFR